MHETELPGVRLYVDRFVSEGDRYVLEGWVLGLSRALAGFRVVGEGRVFGTVLHGQFTKRADVLDFYRISGDQPVGFRLEFQGLDSIRDLSLQVRFPGADEFHHCLTLKNPFFGGRMPPVSARGDTPGLVVIENFYSNPDAVREYALSLEFIDDDRYYKGRRTAARPVFPGTKECFERVLGRRITEWESHLYNGVFQYCIAQDNLVYHSDHQSYAAMVYLSPQAPGDTGTSFFRHRKLGLMKDPSAADCQRFNKTADEIRRDMFQDNYYDRSPWELLDVVGNVYNRLVIFDAKRVHAASGYCGNTKENGRLFHIFFFDVES
jgi:hypothetical protein